MGLLFRLHHAVMQLHELVFEMRDADQFELGWGVGALKQAYALPQCDGMHGQVNLIDQASLEEGGIGFAAAG